MKSSFAFPLFVSLLALSVNSMAASGLGEDANASPLEYRAYTALVKDAPRKGILLLAVGGKLYFPLSELSSHLHPERVLALATDLPQCSPCVPLDRVARYSIDEKRNEIEIVIKPEFVPPKRVISQPDIKQLEASYGGGLATSISLLSRYEELPGNDDVYIEQYAADLDVGLSMGRAGSLYTSQLFLEEGKSFRGSSFYEKYFVGPMLHLQIGDVVSHSDAFGGAVQMGGIRFRRAFETESEYRYRPFFKYDTDARLPGTLELFVNGQRIKQEEYERGQLQIEHGLGASSGELTLVLTDAIGNKTTVRESLFNVNRNLAPGVVDFDLSYGAVRVAENDYEDNFGSAWGSVGITNNWTQSLSYQGDDDFRQASTEVILAIGRHEINLEGAWSRVESIAEEGDASIATYAYGWGDATRVRVSLDYFNSNNFSVFRGGRIDGEGYTATFSVASGGVYGGISGFEIGDLSGGSVNFGVLGRSWYVEASADYLETDDYQAVLTIGYRPRERYAPRVRVAHGWERGDRSVGADVSGSVPVGKRYLGYQIAASQDYDRTKTVDSRAGLNYRGNAVDVYANYSDVNSLARSSARITSGFVISGHDAFLSSRPVSQAYATIITEQPDVVVKGGSYERSTDNGGAATLPVSAFFESRLSIDKSSLNRSDVVSRRSQKVRVVRGNHAAVEMPVTQAPIIIHILNNGVNDVFVNGEPFIHNDFGAYVTKYRPNSKNTFEVAGKRYEIVLPLVEGELPIFEFNRETGKLYRVNELFRSH